MRCTECDIYWYEDKLLQNCPECGADLLPMLNAQICNPSVESFLRNLVLVYGIEFVKEKELLTEKIKNLFSNDKRINNLLQLSVKYDIPQKLALLYYPRSDDLTNQVSALLSSIQEISFLSDDVLFEMFRYWSHAFTLPTKDEPMDGRWVDEYKAIYSSDRRKLIEGCDNVSYSIIAGTEVICRSAFVSEHLKTIIIPSTVHSIGEDAFSNCKSLTHIQVSESNPYFTTVQGVLYNKSLTKLVSYPIGRPEKSYRILESVRVIGTKAFHKSKGLQNIILPASLLSIEDRAFQGSGLNCISIPSLVSSIEKLAFDCATLESINVVNANAHFRSVNGVLFDKRLETIIHFPFHKSVQNEIYEIPSTVKYIDNNAFDGCSGLKSITIPASVISIGAFAFSQCSDIENIYIPSSVTSIGKWAFDYCESLKSIVIPNSVKSIGGFCFYDCNQLKEVTLSDSISSIESSTFSRCYNLSKIIIPESVTSIESNAFDECFSLESILIPPLVTRIEVNAFDGCKNLTRIEVHPMNRYFSSIDGVLFDKELTTIILYPSGKARLEKNYSVPKSVTKIGNASFRKCENLESLIIPDSVTEIGDYALSICSSLKGLEIPSSVISIGKSAFERCFEIESVVLPPNLSIIRDSAFSGCVSLSSITFPDSLTSIEKYAFHGCEKIRHLNFPNSVTSIGSSAFSNCHRLSKIDSLGFPDSIGNFAFAHTCLRSIRIPESVTFIGLFAFYGCNDISQIFISTKDEYLKQQFTKMGLRDRIIESENSI